MADDYPYQEVYDRAQEIVKNLQVFGTIGPNTSNIWNVEVAIDQKDEKGRPYVQVQKWRPDSSTGKYVWGHGSKHYLSPHQTDREIIGQIFAGFMAFNEHELREFFLYKGKRIFGPHISLEALMEAADNIDKREGE